MGGMETGEAADPEAAWQTAEPFRHLLRDSLHPRPERRQGIQTCPLRGGLGGLLSWPNSFASRFGRFDSPKRLATDRKMATCPTAIWVPTLRHFGNPEMVRKAIPPRPRPHPTTPATS